MLVRDTKEVYRHKVESDVGKDASASDVLDYLFGDSFDQRSANFVIREWRKNESSITNRLNMCWAIPLTMLCAPFMYIISGQVGWDTKTPFGRWILRVTGHLHET